MRKLFFGFLPLLLLAIPVVLFLSSGRPLPFGSSILVGDRPPIEELTIGKIRLESDLIELTVINDGPDPVEIRQLLVNGGYWAFEMVPGHTVARLRSATIAIEYPWNSGDDQHITLVTSSGATFGVTIPAAVESPTLDWRFGGSLALIGLLIGVVPVLLGLLWFPFVRTLKANWYNFFMALTLGLLLFLGVDSLKEALEIVPATPKSLNGVAVLLIGFSISFLFLFHLSRGRGRSDAEADESKRRRLIAFSAALGIGIHNLGEGLAVGSAFALGNISLGATLVVGFMIHNVTEGLAIVAPLAKEKARVGNLILLGLLAGAPAIAGTWIGGYAYSPIWSVFFLGIGAGAIFQVAIEVGAYIGRKTINQLYSSHAVAGLLGGLIVMYTTGLIVSG
jgi:zinc transporter, ZIP family